MSGEPWSELPEPSIDSLEQTIAALRERNTELQAQRNSAERFLVDSAELYRVTKERLDQALSELAEARRFLDFAAAQSEWSQATFGADSERGPVGPLKHLAKEVQEALDNIDDEMEYVDCFFLVLDASRRAKIAAPRLLALAFDKLEINKRRKWNKPTPDDPVEHDRSEGAARAVIPESGGVSGGND